MNIPKVNTSHIQVYDELLRHIKNNKSYSLIRLNEGEARLLVIRDNKHPDIIKRYHEQIGFMLNEHEFSNNINWIVKAFLMADVVGIKKPNEIHNDKIITNIANFKPSNDKSWRTKKQYKYLIPNIYNVSTLPHVLKKIMENYNMNLSIKFCSDMIHRDMSTHPRKNINTLLKSIDKLVIVSGHPMYEYISKKYKNISHLECYEIPPQYKYFKERISKSKINDREVIKSIHDIAYKLRNSDRSGQLLLFGAGLYGKFLGSIFKEAGGVSFDFGSGFDYLAGATETRHWVRLTKNKRK